MATGIHNDVTLPTGPTDTVSSLRWSPAHNHLAAASWDGQVYIYDVNTPSSASILATISTGGPVLDTDFSEDGSLILAAGASSSLSLLDAATLTTHTLPSAHTKPIRSCRFVRIPGAQAPLVVTGSWDGTIRYCDLRSPSSSPVATLTVGDRIFAMDAGGNTLAAATAAGNLVFADLAGHLGTAVETRKSPLVRQMTCLAVGGEGTRVAFGGIEGRVGVHGCGGDKHNLTWRCHRDPPTPVHPDPLNPLSSINKSNKKDKNNRQETQVKVWTVNTLSFHPFNRDILATAGSDGTFHFWNSSRQCRTRAFPCVGGAITASGFRRTDGRFFAYAVGYDWHEGHKGNVVGYPMRVVVHPVGEEDISVSK